MKNKIRICFLLTCFTTPILPACEVEIRNHNLYCGIDRINEPLATAYPDAVTHFAAASEGDEVIYIRNNRIEQGAFLGDAFRARRDGSGCPLPVGCPRISRTMPLAHEVAKIAVTKNGDRFAYIWGNRVATNWKIDHANSNGTNRLAVPLGSMIAYRGFPLEFSCDVAGAYLRFGAQEFIGAPPTQWYSDVVGGPPIPFTESWPGRCEIFSDGFESGDTTRWENP